jgi:hypothetical protein
MSDDSYIDAELWEQAEAEALVESVKPVEGAEGRVASLRDFEEIRDRIYADLVEAAEMEGFEVD